MFVFSILYCLVCSLLVNLLCRVYFYNLFVINYFELVFLFLFLILLSLYIFVITKYFK